MLKFSRFLMIILFSAKVYAEQDLGKFKDFVTETGNNVIKILVNRNAPMAERKENFRQVLRDHFDIKAIGKFVLARYWRQVSAEQQTEYLKLFEDALVENYSAQFDNYNNETLVVQEALPAKDGGVVVKSRIVRQAGDPPLQVDWKLFETTKGLKILDIIINGVSMSITQRSEYAGIINSKGGSVDGLIESLRARTGAKT